MTTVVLVLVASSLTVVVMSSLLVKLVRARDGRGWKRPPRIDTPATSAASYTDALRASEQHLAMAQSVTKTGSYEIVPGVEEQRWSDELYRLYGYAPGEVRSTAQAFLDRLHPDDRARLEAAADARWESADGAGATFRIVLPDNTEKVIQTRSHIVRDDDGNPIRKLGIAQDVTERVAVDAALRESEERFRAVFEAAPNGIVVLDQSGKALMVNRAMCEMLGYTLAELEQMPLARVIPQDQRADVYRNVGEVAAGVESGLRRTRGQLVRKDGAVIDIDTSAAPFTLDDTTRGAVFEVRDVTAELALQQQLERSAAEIATVLETAPDPMLRIDDRGMIRRVNAAVEAVFGWSPEELIGQNVSMLAGGEAHAGHRAFMEHFARTGEASTDVGLVVGRTREAVGRRRDGVEFPIEISVAEIPGDGDGDGGRQFTGVMRDVSDRLAARSALEESEERFRTAFDAAQNGMLLLAPDGRTLLQNEALREMVGLSSDGLRKFEQRHGREPHIADFMRLADVERLVALGQDSTHAAEAIPRITATFPNARAHFIEDGGFMWFTDHMDEIFESVTAASAARSVAVAR